MDTEHEPITAWAVVAPNGRHRLYLDNSAERAHTWASSLPAAAVVPMRELKRGEIPADGALQAYAVRSGDGRVCLFYADEDAIGYAARTHATLHRLVTAPLLPQPERDRSTQAGVVRL